MYSVVRLRNMRPLPFHTSLSLSHSFASFAMCAADKPRARPLTVVTYNVYGGGKFSDLRRAAIVGNILGATPAPDVICMQEATEVIIDALQDALGGNYHVFTKLESLRETATPADELNAVREEGFLATLSRYPLQSRRVLHNGGWLDDGLLKCSVLWPNPQVPTPNPSAIPDAVPLTVYNYHGSGGTFGKPMHFVLKKRAQRVDELRVLQEDVRAELTESEKMHNGVAPFIVVAGDFNSDCNDPETFPESAGFSEKVLDGKTLSHTADADTDSASPEGDARVRAFDVWSAVHKSAAGSHTESHMHNAFRAWLKPSQNREATFDRVVVVYRHASHNTHAVVDPLSVRLIGNEKVKTLALDKDGNIIEDMDKAVDTVNLFASDHFGLIARLDPRVVTSTDKGVVTQ